MRIDLANDVSHIHSRLENVRLRIHKAMQEAGRVDKDEQVKLVAVSKFHSAKAVQCAATFGQLIFGESYLQEALSKQEELSALTLERNIEWHFVGHIQSRKAKDIVGRFALLHSVDTIKLATLLNKFAQQKNIIQSVLIQVNIGNEEQKSGVSLDELHALAQCIMQSTHLKLEGLMCLPPVFDAGLAARPYFAKLRHLKDELSRNFELSLPHLSMGMSGDLEAAIIEGSSMLRIGTDIFGARQG